MMRQDAFDREDYTHDPPEQIKKCLECTAADCNDCYGAQSRGQKARYIFYLFNGVPKTVTEIADEVGLARATLAHRIKVAELKPGDEVKDVAIRGKYKK